MAIRTVRTIGDEVLRKKCKEVKLMTPSLKQLIGDLFDTMREEDGVGLAAPQVGILRRICVVDTGEESFVLVNPVIVETSGEQEGQEGCLSVPGKFGIIKRPDYVKVKALDENMNERFVEGEALTARAICHEMEHLDGILYVDHTDQIYSVGDKVPGFDDSEDDEEAEDPDDVNDMEEND